MKKGIYCDLYELRELTESIYRVRQAMSLLKNSSYEYKEMTKIYDDLWRKRDALEAKIISKHENDVVDNYWVI